MNDIPGYKILKKLSFTPHTEVWLAFAIKEQIFVVLKTISKGKADFSKNKELLHHEAIILDKLYPNEHQFVENESETFLVLNCFQGSTLEEFIKKYQFDVKSFLEISLRLLEQLEFIHSNNIIHKDIKPSNILITPDYSKVQIIDFGLSTYLSKETQTVVNPGMLEGTISYISPEQTGRTNASIDYRSDYYSLGVALYELATKRLPFETNDPLELIYCHIAKNRPNAHKINPELPETVSEIIKKLMAIVPEDRYQSAYGIKADLMHALNEWTTQSAIKPFTLGKNERPSKFNMSQKFYGREKETKELLLACERVGSGGRAEMLLIAGQPGIGKTSLIQKIVKPLTRSQGFFTSGKSEDFKRNKPLGVLIEAFRKLILQLLTEPEDAIMQWKSNILQSLGPNARLMTDEIPELTLLIGPQPPLPTLPPLEAKNRFIFTFEHFVYVFATQKHPLILFLDDLQWADNETLELLEGIFTNPETRYFLVLGAYRDTEVSATHPLSFTLEKIKKHGAALQTFFLSPLSIKEISLLVSDSLYTPVDEVESLVDIVYKKTGGNPFFIGELFKSLYENKLIFFDTKKHQWSWKIAEIEKAGYTENVIDLMVQKIGELSPLTQQILMYGACIGARFKLGILSTLLQQPPKVLAEALLPCLELGLIESKEDTYRLIEKNDPHLLANAEYSFSHDRVQEAASSLLPELETEKIHFEIGKAMLQKVKNENLNIDEYIFDIANHCNFGVKQITSKEDKQLIVETNHAAGKKARTTASFTEAVHYYTHGHKLLDEEIWEKQRDMAFEIELYLAECQFLIGEHKKGHEILDNLLKIANTKLEKGLIYERKVMFANIQRSADKTVENGIKALSLFNINIPMRPTNEYIKKQLAELTKQFETKTHEELLNQHSVDNTEICFIAKMLAILPANAYDVDKNLLYTIVFSLMSLILKHGFTGFSTVYGYHWFGLYFLMEQEDIETALKYVSLGEELKIKHGISEGEAKLCFVPGAFIYPWVKPFSSSLDTLAYGVKRGIESGDYLYAGYDSFCYAMIKFISGASIPDLVQDTQKYLEFCEHAKLVDFYNTIYIVTHRINEVLGKAEAPKDFYENEFRKMVFDTTDPTPKDFYYLYRTITLYILGDIEEAWKIAKESEIMFRDMVGFITNADRALFLALIAGERYRDPSLNKYDKNICLQTIKDNIKRLKKWSDDYPQNFRYRYLMAEGEYEVIKGNFFNAIQYFESAAKLAKEGESLYIYAIALERISYIYHDIQSQQGKDRDSNKRWKNISNLFSQQRILTAKECEFLMHNYMSDAYVAWIEYGALKKAKMLEEQFPFIKSLQRELSSDSEISTSNLTLDVLALMKASAALSQEVEPEKLTETLLRILMEESNAQYAVIMQLQGGMPVVLAAGDIEKQDAFIDKPIPYTEFALPSSIIQYLLRLQKKIIIRKAVESDLFKDDPYIKAKNVNSILVLPIFHTNKLVEIIYLENNTAANVFTEKQISFLEHLSAQIFISLENSRLYSNINRFLPKEFFRLLGKRNILDVHIGDSTRTDLSVLFSDIRDFTKRSEKLSPQEAFEFINNWLQFIEPIVRKNNGVIDKYVGDAVLILFPGKTSDDAVKAAVELLEGLETQFNKQLKARGLEPLKVGIGINTGPTTLGIVGSPSHMEATVISDVVNTASRVEDFNKIIKTTLLITEETKKFLAHPEFFDLRYIGNFLLRGRDAPVRLWEVFNNDDEIMRENKYQTLDYFNQGVILFEAGKYKQAKEKFQRCLEKLPTDKTLIQYINFCNKQR